MGNLTQSENGQHLRWDTENRLIAAVVGAATNGYAYDRHAAVRWRSWLSQGWQTRLPNLLPGVISMEGAP